MYCETNNIMWNIPMFMLSMGNICGRLFVPCNITMDLNSVMMINNFIINVHL